ncbi:MAG: GLPGLI family protein [Muribaculaceae bacterium]|nr:GLPGLI family protein [Muribaculaceae bacterium]
MKRLLTSFIICFAAMAAMAQNRADIIVSYDEVDRHWERDSLETVRMTLLANAGEAKYFNDISLWTDSLKSTPEGKEQWQQIIMAACMTRTPEGGISIDMRKGPVKKVDTYVFTSSADDKLRYYSKFAGEPCYYDEPLSEMQWQIGDSTATVLGYECVMATSDYHGRRWTAWFSPEIPVPFGPWKLHGLPGLILKAQADNGRTYTATGVANTDRIISPMYSADVYERTERKQALAEHEHFLNNREALMKARFGGRVQFVGDSEERPKYDAARHAPEPDYR